MSTAVEITGAWIQTRTLAEVPNEIVIVVDRIVILDDLERLQLTVERPFRDGSLGDIGPIQVVHAVGPNDTGLQFERLRLVRIKVEVPVLRRKPHISSSTCAQCLPVFCQFVLELGNQHADSVPSHVLAFCVEVKVLVPHIGHV